MSNRLALTSNEEKAIKIRAEALNLVDSIAGLMTVIAIESHNANTVFHPFRGSGPPLGEMSEWIGYMVVVPPTPKDGSKPEMPYLVRVHVNTGLTRPEGHGGHALRHLELEDAPVAVEVQVPQTGIEDELAADVAKDVLKTLEAPFDKAAQWKVSSSMDPALAAEFLNHIAHGLPILWQKALAAKAREDLAFLLDVFTEANGNSEVRAWHRGQEERLKSQRASR
jgi:hypothetical protein